MLRGSDDDNLKQIDFGEALRTRLLARKLLREPQGLMQDLFAPSSMLREALSPQLPPPPPPPPPRQARKRQRDVDEDNAADAERQLAPTVDDGAIAGSSSDHAGPDQPKAAGAATPAAAAAALPSEALAVLANLSKSLREGSLSEEARASKCAPGLRQLLSYSEPEQMLLACAAIDLMTLPDEGVLCACQAAASPEVSTRAAASFTASALLPRLAALEQPASRTLFSAMLLMLHRHARPVLEALVLPALFLKQGQLSSGQAEALTRLLKELPQALLGKALAGFLAGEAGVPAPWTEQQVAVLQAVVQRKPTLDAATVAELLVQADANVDALFKSVKFSNLLNTLVRSHGAQLKPHVPAVRRIAERIGTFQQKPILAALTKLEADGG
jgi:hypothetical protein